MNKKQIIILETNNGSAHSEKQLKEVWEERLKRMGIFYYKIKSVKIEK